MENPNLPKVVWWQEQKKLFEIEESYFKQAREAYAAGKLEDYKIYSGLANEALRQTLDSVQETDDVTKRPTREQNLSNLPKTTWWQRLKERF